MIDSDKKIIIANAVADYLNHISKHLPGDIHDALCRLRDEESDKGARSIYETMFRNMELAAELGKPLCQDTGLVQFKIKCGALFPAINELAGSLEDAVRIATEKAPLRPNCIVSFEEKNTDNNVGDGVPVVSWEIVPGRDDCEITAYLAGGGSSMPGKAEVLMPSAGYEAVIPFVLDRVAEYGPNACPPLFIGVGVGNSVETAAMNSKNALFRDVDTSNDNPKAAKLEKLLEEGLNKMGIGPQGLGGSTSVMGVNLISSARHPATLAVAVSFGCWCHRRGRLHFDRELNYESQTHPGFVK